MQQMKIGIVGCGVISDRYFEGLARSAHLAVKSCYDLNPENAARKAAQFGVEAVSYDSMLADEEIGLVVNLTVPAAHAEISIRALEAGKHVYSEKPVAASVAAAREVLQRAMEKGLRVGCAPDTFFGAAHQTVRCLLDDGAIGHIVGGAVAFVSRGMEAWHPNPLFFFRPGGGPLLDLGPYYVTQLVNLFGPVQTVWSRASIGYAERTVGSGALTGQKINVEVPTTVNGLITFHSGLSLPVTASWDVWKHGRNPIELYGTEGSLLNPNPVFFDGEVKISRQDQDWAPVAIDRYPFGVQNRITRSGARVADYRAVGVIDMAAAIKAGRPHRADSQIALHVLEVLEGLERSNGREIAIESSCQRPEPLPEGLGEEIFWPSEAK